MESFREETTGRTFSSGRLIVGLFLLLQGVLIALSWYDLIPSISLWEYWPVILILVGALKVVQPGASRIGGFLLAGIGGLLLGDNLDLYDIDFRDLFPFLLILLGLFLVIGAFRRRPGPSSSADSSSTIDAFAVLGGVRRAASSQTFRGGNVGAVLGGCEVDLRQAAIPEGAEAVLEVFAMWGGVDIAVPQGWSVSVQGFPLLGAFEDHTTPPFGGSSQRLVVRGLVIMGGVDVKHKLDS